MFPQGTRERRRKKKRGREKEASPVSEETKSIPLSRLALSSEEGGAKKEKRGGRKKKKEGRKAVKARGTEPLPVFFPSWKKERKEGGEEGEKRRKGEKTKNCLQHPHQLSLTSIIKKGLGRQEEGRKKREKEKRGNPPFCLPSLQGGGGECKKKKEKGKGKGGEWSRRSGSSLISLSYILLEKGKKWRKER